MQVSYAASWKTLYLGAQPIISPQTTPRSCVYFMLSLSQAWKGSMLARWTLLWQVLTGQAVKESAENMRPWKS